MAINVFNVFNVFNTVELILSLFTSAICDEGCERDVVHRMNEGYRAWGALKKVS